MKLLCVLMRELSISSHRRYTFSSVKIWSVRLLPGLAVMFWLKESSCDISVLFIIYSGVKIMTEFFSVEFELFELGLDVVYLLEFLGLAEGDLLARVSDGLLGSFHC